MKELWVLSVRTSLPDECDTKADLKTTVSAFETFEKAKKAMRDTAKEFAFSKNTMFEADGRITALDKYIGYMYEDIEDEECCEDFLTSGILLKIHNNVNFVYFLRFSSVQFSRSVISDTS